MRRSSKVIPATRAIGRCPYCGGDQLIGAGRRKALCASCRRCWSVEGDLVRWVSPTRCEGCVLEGLCQSPVDIEGRAPVLSAPVQRPRRVTPSRQPVGPRPLPAPAPTPLPPA